jgi:flagellar biosynthesis component FlhA
VLREELAVFVFLISCFVVCPMLAVFLDCPILIALSGSYNVSLMTFSIAENKNIKIFHRKHQF